MITLNVNGSNRRFDGDPTMPLLWYLRDVLGLTGTKFGCGMALCGACTVHKNGEATRSCITPMSAAAGALQVRLEKVGHYCLGRGYPEPAPDDVRRAEQEDQQ